MATDHIPVAVVGAGPYGLSLSTHLHARGVAHRIFGRPMSMWSERMPRGMLLKSEGFASNISDPFERYTLREYSRRHGLPYTDVGTPVSLETFVGYGRWFQQVAVPQVEPLDVVRLEQSERGFRLELSDGSDLSADQVVMAVGVGSFAYVPPELSGLPAPLFSHTSGHRDLSGFAGKSVALVGGGQSALETAALLHEAGARPQVLVRKGNVHWNESSQGRSVWARICAPHTQMGASWKLKAYLRAPGTFRYLRPETRVNLVRTKLGPAGAWWLRERVEGKVPVNCAMRVRSTEVVDGRVRLTLECGGDRHAVEADHVMAATGFRVDLARLSYLEESLRSRVRTYEGFPVLSRHFESSVPGLFFVGLAAALTYGPLLRFVHGSALASKWVSAAAERRQ